VNRGQIERRIERRIKRRIKRMLLIGMDRMNRSVQISIIRLIRIQHIPKIMDKIMEKIEEQC
jgi:hypothetical protein